MNYKYLKKIIFTLEIIIITTCLIYSVKFFLSQENHRQIIQIEQHEMQISNEHIKAVFKEIYGKNLWEKHGLGYGGGSGWGSSVNFTKLTRDIIFKIVQNYKINSILDAPCGSAIWMTHLLNNITRHYRRRFRYLGVDIVDNILEEAKKNFHNPNIKFISADFSQSLRDVTLPYELIISRDGFQHLPLSRIIDSLRLFSQVKGARYLLVSSYLSNQTNRNIRIGDYFPINLAVHPFNMTKYLAVFREVNANVKNDQKYLLLYDIPNYVGKLDFELMKHEANKIKSN